MMILLNGKALAAEMEDALKARIRALKGRPPCLAVVQVGHNPASTLYIKRKEEACNRVGIRSIKKHLDETVSQEELFHTIRSLNEDPSIDGILVQQPLPKQINTHSLLESMDPNKDVDGFHPLNMGRLLMGDKDAFIPCTTLGIFLLLQKYQIPLAGKRVVIVGRSNIVGKPTAALLMQPWEACNATVTLAHSKTENLPQICAEADILIAAMGKPRFIGPTMVKKGACVIDVGINRIDDPTTKSGFRLVGDVDFDSVKHLCSHITPVPGGIGPLTIASLLQNTLKAYNSPYAK